MLPHSEHAVVVQCWRPAIIQSVKNEDWHKTGSDLGYENASHHFPKPSDVVQCEAGRVADHDVSWLITSYQSRRTHTTLTAVDYHAFHSLCHVSLVTHAVIVGYSQFMSCHVSSFCSSFSYPPSALISIGGFGELGDLSANFRRKGSSPTNHHCGVVSKYRSWLFGFLTKHRIARVWRTDGQNYAS